MENHVELDKLEHLEYLLAQSLNGIHLLFDNKDIARVMSRTKEEEEFSMQRLKDMQSLLTDFIAQESLQDKLDFLSELKEEDHALLIETYFNLLENSIKDKRIEH